MAYSSFGDRKQVQDARFDNHLTAVQKENNSTQQWVSKKVKTLKTFYLVKTKSAVSFSALM